MATAKYEPDIGGLGIETFLIKMSSLQKVSVSRDSILKSWSRS